MYKIHLERQTVPPSYLWNRFPRPLLPYDEEFVRKYNELIKDFQIKAMKLCSEFCENRARENINKISNMKESYKNVDQIDNKLKQIQEDVNKSLEKYFLDKNNKIMEYTPLELRVSLRNNPNSNSFNESNQSFSSQRSNSYKRHSNNSANGNLSSNSNNYSRHQSKKPRHKNNNNRSNNSHQNKNISNNYNSNTFNNNRSNFNQERSKSNQNNYNNSNNHNNNNYNNFRQSTPNNNRSQRQSQNYQARFQQNPQEQN